jgi:hypothetical protein
LFPRTKSFMSAKRSSIVNTALTSGTPKLQRHRVFTCFQTLYSRHSRAVPCLCCEVWE